MMGLLVLGGGLWAALLVRYRDDPTSKLLLAAPAGLGLVAHAVLVDVGDPDEARTALVAWAAAPAAFAAARAAANHRMLDRFNRYLPAVAGIVLQAAALVTGSSAETQVVLPTPVGTLLVTDVAHLLLVLTTARVFAEEVRGQSASGSFRPFRALGVLWALSMLISTIASDMGMAALAALTILTITFLTVRRINITGRIAVPVLATLALGVARRPYVIDRFATFQALREGPPTNGPLDQEEIARYAASAGRWFGAGFDTGNLAALGNSAGEDLLLMAAAHTIGLIGVAGVLLGVAAVLSALLLAAHRQPTLARRLVLVGITVYLGARVVISGGGQTGLIPFTGVTFPFFAAGATGALTVAAALGYATGAAAPATRAEARAAPAPARPAFPIPTATTVAVLTVGAVLASAGDITVGDTWAASARNAFTRGGYVAVNVPFPTIETRDGHTVARSVTEAGTTHRVYDETGLYSHLLGVIPNGGSPTGLERWLVDEHRDADRPVRLTIVHDLQVRAAELVAASGHDGALVVIDTATGAIITAVDTTGVLLANPNTLASPGYDPTDGHTTLYPPGRGPVTVHTPRNPGSVLKPLIYALAIDAGVVTDTTRFPTESAWSPNAGNRTRENYAGSALGGTLDEVIAYSANTAAMRTLVAVRACVDPIDLSTPVDDCHDIDRTFDRFGFHTAPDSQVPIAESRYELRPDDRQDTLDEVTICAIGQGECRVTLVHLAAMYSAFGNGGTIPTPTFVVDDTQAPWVDEAFSDTAAARIVDAMTVAAETGTANALAAHGVAAKTGTADNVEGGADGWVAGITLDGRYAFAAMLLGGTGSVGGGRVGATLLPDYLGLLNLLQATEPPRVERRTP